LTAKAAIPAKVRTGWVQKKSALFLQPNILGLARLAILAVQTNFFFFTRRR
jgi:hypothetical protein